MRHLLVLFSLLLVSCGGSEPPAYELKLSGIYTTTGVEYAFERGTRNEIVLAFAAGIDDFYTGTAGFGSLPAELKDAGFNVVTLDLPCHGADATLGLSGLECWRQRIEGGSTTIFTQFCAKVSAVLDELEAGTVYAAGISRGGYIALTCAGRDDRISRVAAIMPVTDLQRLLEFDGYTVDQSTFGLARFDLSRVDVLVRIGNNDQRVGTDAALAFAATLPRKTVQLLDSPGHTVIEDGSVAQWLAH